MTILYPLTGRITSVFGDKRNRPRPHTGTDIGGRGSIKAGARGVVHHVGPNPAGPNSGNVVTVKYQVAGGTLYAMYCHVAGSYPVKVGDIVYAGTDIAIVGHSGTGDGAHVHIECYLNGRLVNPEHYFGGVVPAGGDITPLDPETETEEDDMAQPFYYIASSNNRTVTVGTGDTWVRSQPGEPLRRLTSGQAADYFERDGLDYNSPNVVSKPGEWFDAAFAEDAIVHGYNITTHPYLADALVSVKLDESAVAALEAALQDEFAAIPDAVRQNIKNAL